MVSSALTLLPTVLTYSLVLLTLLWCWFQWTHRDLLRVARKLPVTLSLWPILGHSYVSFWGREEMARYVMEFSARAVSKGIKTICFWCGPLPILAVHGVEDIQTVLNSSNSLDKADEYEFFKIGFDSTSGSFNYSLLTAPGSVWKITRKHMNPLFHPRNVQHMMPVFNQNSRELVSCLSEHVGRGPVNMLTHTMDVSLKTVCNLIFGPGVDIDMHSSDFQGLMSVVEMIPEFFIKRLLRPWLRNEKVFRYLYRSELQKLNTVYNTFTEKRLEIAKEISKRKKLKANISVENDNENEYILDDEGPLNIVDAYTILQKNFPQFTEADMRYEMLTFYCTGTDTVGSGAASCFLALAQFQDIQERLYQEISSVVGPDDDVTLEDLNRMPYLDQVLKETLRWSLIVPYTLRKATKDIALSDCTVPAGNTIIVCLAAIHTNPNLYPEPFKFDPDRFSPENASKKERISFIPFSGGPRNCIAKTYAMHLTKIIIVHVLRKFRLTTEMDIFKLRKRLIVALINADGYNITFERRS